LGIAIAGNDSVCLLFFKGGDEGDSVACEIFHNPYPLVFLGVRIPDPLAFLGIVS
jgi:hypothetical protein